MCFLKTFTYCNSIFLPAFFYIFFIFYFTKYIWNFIVINKLLEILIIFAHKCEITGLINFLNLYSIEFLHVNLS